MLDFGTLAITLVTAPVSVALVNGLFARVRKHKEALSTKGKPLFVNGDRDEIIALLDEFREGNLAIARRQARAESKAGELERELRDVVRRFQDMEQTIESAFSYENKIADLIRRVQRLESEEA